MGSEMCIRDRSTTTVRSLIASLARCFNAVGLVHVLGVRSKKIRLPSKAPTKQGLPVGPLARGCCLLTFACACFLSLMHNIRTEDHVLSRERRGEGADSGGSDAPAAAHALTVAREAHGPNDATRLRG